MKKLLIVCLVLTGFVANAQQSSRYNYGLTAGAGLGKIIKVYSDDAPNFGLQRNFAVGANLYMPLTEGLNFETGLIYNYYRLSQKSSTHPDVPEITTYYDVNLLYLPAFLRIYLSEHYFVNGGPIVDMDFSNPLGLSSSKVFNSQSGLGAGIGVGGELEISPKLYLQINPYLNFHGVWRVKREENQGSIFDTGLKIGIRTKR